MTIILSIIALAVVQGFAELLPISSSAHVIVAEKLLGMDPTAPETTLLLVMLHTGTMIAVIAYFWRSWKVAYFSSGQQMRRAVKPLFLATVMTAVVGMALKVVIERFIFHNAPKAEVELLFGNLPLISAALAAVGVFIVYAGLRRSEPVSNRGPGIETKQAIWIGLVQGLSLPFRGFSRSGATISCGLAAGASKTSAEEFSFALAVILTPPVVIREGMRLLASRQALAASGNGHTLTLFLPGLLGLVCSLLAGLLALRWLTRWLDRGRWHYFGYYCLFAAAAVLLLHAGGY
jgi:undecaprenyl-diphosphatase